MRWRRALQWLPNGLSAARLAAAPVLIVLAIAAHEQVFAILLVAALATDVLDGWLARLLRVQSNLGAALDSIADVTTLMAATVGIWRFHPHVLAEHVFACGVVLGGWAVVCAVALLRYRRLSSFHTYASKAAGYALGFFLIALFVSGFSAWLFYTAIVLSACSSAEELVLLWMLPHWRSDVRGIWWVLRERG